MLESGNTLSKLGIPGASLASDELAGAAPLASESTWWHSVHQRLSQLGFFRAQLPQQAYLSDRPGWDRQE